MKTVLLFLLLVISPYVWSQKRLNRDSVFVVIKTSRQDTSKINLYFDLASDYVLNSTDSSKIYWKKGKSLIDKLHAPQYDFKYYFTGVKIFHAEQNYEKALEYNLKALKKAEKNKNSKDEAEALRSLFIMYLNLGKDSLAITTAHKALYLTEQLNDTVNLPITFGNLSRLYSELRQYEKAIKYGKKGIEVSKKHNSIKGLLICLNNVAISQKEIGQREEAENTLNEIKSLAYKNDVPRSVVKSLVNLSFMAQERGDKYALHKHLTELDAFILRNQMGKKIASNEEGIPFLKAYNHFYQNRYNDAENIANDQLKELGDDHFMKNSYYELLVKMSYARGDFTEGERYERKSDSIENIISKEDLNSFEIDAGKKYQTAKKDLQIKEQKAKLENRRLLNYIFAGTVLGIVSIGFLVYRNLKHRQTIQKQKIMELQAEKQLTATEAVLRGEEQERSRIAKDLHDGLGGMLSGVKLSFNAMKENLVMTPENAKAFERSIDQLDHSIREMRRVAHNMLPENLLKYDLDSALREFCTELNRTASLKIDYQSIDMENQPFSPEISIACYRIIQELVTNSLKHAEAKHLLVQVHLSKEEKMLHITVEDDGKGFDQNILQNSNGIGWRNIRNRVQLMKGKIDLNAGTDTGTSILIEIPML